MIKNTSCYIKTEKAEIFLVVKTSSLKAAEVVEYKIL